ncbi:hypothetical protein OIU78_015218, partial [Salix suchowensis]
MSFPSNYLQERWEKNCVSFLIIQGAFSLLELFCYLSSCLLYSVLKLADIFFGNEPLLFLH